MQVLNKKAKLNYNLYEKFEAGIMLKGIEVKVIKNGQIDLSNAYVKIIRNEIFLINANVPINNMGNNDSTRIRKLLVHKGELTSIESKIRQKRLTLVPTRVYTKGPFVKIEVAMAKSKRKYEKREDIKKRDIEREIAQNLKTKQENIGDARFRR